MDPHASRLAKDWGFQPEIELPGGYCSRVYANAGQVLKIPFQGEEQTSGCLAAVRMSGNVGPRVVEFDTATGALLMERVVPGTKLSESGLSDDECRRIVLDFASRIRQLDPRGLMPVSQYISRRDPLALRLLETTTQEVFLHGDLHHENVLLGPDGWVVIDPKGLVGDPAFEPSAFLRNSIPWIGTVPDLAGFLRRRIKAVAAETGFDPWRIAAWAMVAPGSEVADGPWLHVRSALAELLAEMG